MTIKIIRSEKNILEIDVDHIDPSLAQLIVEKLNETKGVEFAAWKKAHPVVGTPHIIVKTKGANPVSLVTKKLEEIKKEVGDFKKEFSGIVK